MAKQQYYSFQRVDIASNATSVADASLNQRNTKLRADFDFDKTQKFVLSIQRYNMIENYGIYLA